MEVMKMRLKIRIAYPDFVCDKTGLTSVDMLYFGDTVHYDNALATAKGELEQCEDQGKRHSLVQKVRKLERQASVRKAGFVNAIAELHGDKFGESYEEIRGSAQRAMSGGNKAGLGEVYDLHLMRLQLLYQYLQGEPDALDTVMTEIPVQTPLLFIGVVPNYRNQVRAHVQAREKALRECRAEQSFG